MTGEEIARNVQFTVNQSGKTTAVVLTSELGRQLKERLAAGPVASGTLRWEGVSKDWA